MTKREAKIASFARFMDRNFNHKDTLVTTDEGTTLIQFRDTNLDHLTGLRRQRPKGPNSGQLMEAGIQGKEAVSDVLGDYDMNAKYGDLKINLLPKLEKTLDGGYLAVYKGKNPILQSGSYYLTDADKTAAFGLRPTQRLQRESSKYTTDKGVSALFTTRDLTRENLDDFEFHPIRSVATIEHGSEKGRMVYKDPSHEGPLNGKPLERGQEWVQQQVAQNQADQLKGFTKERRTDYTRISKGLLKQVGDRVNERSSEEVKEVGDPPSPNP